MKAIGIVMKAIGIVSSMKRDLYSMKRDLYLREIVLYWSKSSNSGLLCRTTNIFGSFRGLFSPNAGLF